MEPLLCLSKTVMTNSLILSGSGSVCRSSIVCHLSPLAISARPENPRNGEGLLLQIRIGLSIATLLKDKSSGANREAYRRIGAKANCPSSVSYSMRSDPEPSVLIQSLQKNLSFARPDFIYGELFLIEVFCFRPTKVRLSQVANVRSGAYDASRLSNRNGRIGRSRGS